MSCINDALLLISLYLQKTTEHRWCQSSHSNTKHSKIKGRLKGSAKTMQNVLMLLLFQKPQTDTVSWLHQSVWYTVNYNFRVSKHPLKTIKYIIFPLAPNHCGHYGNLSTHIISATTNTTEILQEKQFSEHISHFDRNSKMFSDRGSSSSPQWGGLSSVAERCSQQG